MTVNAKTLRIISPGKPLYFLKPLKRRDARHLVVIFVVIFIIIVVFVTYSSSSSSSSRRPKNDLRSLLSTVRRGPVLPRLPPPDCSAYSEALVVVVVSRIVRLRWLTPFPPAALLSRQVAPHYRICLQTRLPTLLLRRLHYEEVLRRFSSP